MLHLSRNKNHQFSGQDLVNILETRGWEAILPRSLSDSQLVRLSDQLRGFLWDEGALRPDEDPNAAIELALLLMAKVNPSLFPLNQDLPWGGKKRLLRDVLLVLHVEASREVLSRTVNRCDAKESLEMLSGISNLVGANFQHSVRNRNAEKSQTGASTIESKGLFANA